MNSLVAGSGSRTRAGLAGLRAACCRVAIVTGLTALAPRPGRVVETLLWGNRGGNAELKKKSGGELARGAPARLLGFAGSHTIAFQRSFQTAAVINKGGGGVETYQAAARLGVTPAGVTVAVAPLAGAQVKAGAGAGVAVVALLQSRHRK